MAGGASPNTISHDKSSKLGFIVNGSPKVSVKKVCVGICTRHAFIALHCAAGYAICLLHDDERLVQLYNYAATLQARALNCAIQQTTCGISQISMMATEHMWRYHTEGTVREHVNQCMSYLTATKMGFARHILSTRTSTCLYPSISWATAAVCNNQQSRQQQLAMLASFAQQQLIQQTHTSFLICETT